MKACVLFAAAQRKGLSLNIHINSFFIPCVVKTVTQEMIAANVWRSLLKERVLSFKTWEASMYLAITLITYTLHSPTFSSCTCPPFIHTKDLTAPSAPFSHSSRVTLQSNKKMRWSLTSQRERAPIFIVYCVWWRSCGGRNNWSCKEFLHWQCVLCMILSEEQEGTDYFCSQKRCKCYLVMQLASFTQWPIVGWRHSLTLAKFTTTTWPHNTHKNNHCNHKLNKM